MRRIWLNFQGYTWDSFRWQIAHMKGIVLVYRGKLDHEGFITLLEIIYIFYGSTGGSNNDNMIERIRGDLAPDEMLFYSIAEIDVQVADLVVESLVYYISPRYNEKINNRIDGVMLECSGKCGLLSDVLPSL